MAVYYRCDYNKIPLKEMIKSLYGKSIPYTDYAYEQYNRGRCIYLSDSNRVFGECDLRSDAIPTSKAMSSISLGRL